MEGASAILVFAILAAMTVSASQVVVIDGDTLRVGREHFRLLGIDAPEIHACPRRRRCAPGDGQASRRSLQDLIAGRVTIRRGGRDRYGRTLAHVYASGQNVACTQIARRQAIYRADWDDGRRLAQECPAARSRRRLAIAGAARAFAARLLARDAAVAARLSGATHFAASGGRCARRKG
jgi:micrococcal nuclease